MGQKSNPTLNRLETGNLSFQSSWYSHYYYTDLLVKDIYLRAYLSNFFKQIEYLTPRIFFIFSENQIDVHVYFLKNNFLIPTINFLKGNRFKSSHLRRNITENKKYNSYVKIKENNLNNELLNKLNYSSQYFNRKTNRNSVYVENIKRENVEKLLLKTSKIQYKHLDGLNNKESISKVIFLIYTLYYSKRVNVFIENQKKNKYLEKKQKELVESRSKEKVCNIKTVADEKSSNNLYLKIPTLEKIFKNKYKFKTEKRKDVKKESSIFEILQNFVEEATFDDVYNGVCKKIAYSKSIKSQKLTQLIPNFYFYKCVNSIQSSLFLAEELVYYIDNRVSISKIKNYLNLRFLSLFKKGNVTGKDKKLSTGVRVSFSGCLTLMKGDKGRTEWVKYGNTSLNVFSEKICFSNKESYTPYGVIGVKVWISYK